MPQVVAIVGAFFQYGYTAWQFWAVVAVSVYSYDQQRTARIRARREYNNSLQDRVINVATVDGARARVYGRVRCADGIIFKGTHGTKSEKLTLVIALAGHEIDAVESVYFNDRVLILSGEGYVGNAPWAGNDRQAASRLMPPGSTSFTLPSDVDPLSIQVIVEDREMGRMYDQVVAFTIEGNVLTTGEEYVDEVRRVVYQRIISGSRARVRAFLGGPGQDLSTVLAADFPGLINSAHKFSGIACLVVQLQYDQDAFPMGPPTISAVIRGAKVLDPRDGVTRWTENPALIARDFALYAHGGAATADDLDEPSFVAAANACDVVATFNTVNADGTGLTQNLPTFTAGLLARSDQAPDQVMSDIVNAMAGKWAWAGGKLRVRAGSYQAPVATLTEDWISDKGDIELVATQARSELVNVITPTIANKAQDFVAAPIPRIVATEYIAADGGEYPLDLTLDAVTDTPHAAHVAGVMLRGGRQALTVSLPCNMRALVLELFDTVAVTLPRLGWSAKPFEVLGWGFTIEGGIKLTLRETDASIYTVGALFTRSDAAPNTALPNPYTVPAIVPTSLASGTDQLLRQADGTVISRLKVAWAEIQDEAVRNGGAVELRYGPASNDPSTWLTAVVPGADTQVLLTGVQDGAAYAVSIRARNKLVAGAWSPLQVHVVQGKSAPPGDVQDLASALTPGGVALSWTASLDADYAETELRLVPADLVGGIWDWADAVMIWRGTGTSYLWSPEAAGEYLVVARHFDTSGNGSTTLAELEVSYTGAALQSPLLDFSRPVILLVADADGVVASYATATTGVRVLSGGVDVTEDWTLARVDGADVTSSLVDGVLTITELLADEGAITVTAEREDFIALTRELPLLKVKAGPAGPGGGDFVDYRFRRLATPPATPTGNTPANWFDAPPAGTDPLWMITGRKNGSGVLQGVWSTPVRLDGAAGSAGSPGDSAQVEYSVNGSSGWHGTFTAGDIFMRVRVGAAAWSAAIRIVGENGAPATAYWLARSAASVQKAINGVYTPGSIVFSAYSQTGAGSPAPYAGRFIIATSADGTNYSTAYTSASNQSGTTFTVPAGIKSIRVRLYLAGGTTTLLDEEVIPVVADGAAGGAGPTGPTGPEGPTGPQGPTGPTGGAGVSTYTATVYRQSATTPERPTGGSYNFSTGLLVAPTAWSITQPASTTTPTWACEYTFSTTTPTATVSGGQWSVPYVDAVRGADGLNVLVLEIYLQQEAAPATPTGGSYTFTGDVFTPPGGGWSRELPASTEVPTWRSAVRFATSTPGTPTAAGAWSPPVVVARSGIDGLTAKALTLAASSQIFRIDKAGAATPSAIVLSAQGSNVAGSPTFSVVAGTATLSGSGNSRTLNFGSLSTDAATIQVTWDGLTDTITVAKLREGSDSVSRIVSNEAHALPADTSGVVSDYTGSGTTLQVFEGSTALEFNTVLAAGRFIIGTPVVSPAAAITVGARSGSGSTTATVAAHSAASSAADVITITYPVTARKADGSDVAFSVVQTLTKAKAGTPGGPGSPGQRGSVETSRAIAGTTWSNTEAATAISAAGYGSPVVLDRVTLYNAGAAYVETRYWDGSAWVAFSTLINGNLLVLGSIGADKMAANLMQADNVLTRGLTVRDNSGNVILSSGVPLAAARITPAAGWLNSNVTLSGLGYTGVLDATRNNQPFRATTAPANPVTGDIWIDISSSPHKVRVWAAGDWRLSSTVGASFTVGAEGQISGQIGSGNISTWIANAAIGTAQIANAAITFAKIDTATITNLASLNAFTGQLTVDNALTISATGHIKGGQSTYATGTGFFLGYHGATYKFSIGSSSQYVRWTGTALEVKLNAVSLSAGAFTGGSFPKSSSITRSLGSVTVTATGGTAPYTYVWTYTWSRSDGGLPSSYDKGGASFSGATASAYAAADSDCAISVVCTCTVTDANGLSATIYRGVSATFGSGPP